MAGAFGQRAAGSKRRATPTRRRQVGARGGPVAGTRRSGESSRLAEAKQRPGTGAAGPAVRRQAATTAAPRTRPSGQLAGSLTGVRGRAVPRPGGGLAAQRATLIGRRPVARPQTRPRGAFGGVAAGTRRKATSRPRRRRGAFGGYWRR
ncbi:hypothetical protein KAR91_39205 [Candidatus Pacearchaeota archaeon]|nr:hypothetical protein [Candidatus Pacearchaeota archaeon]